MADLPKDLSIGASFSPERFEGDQVKARQAFAWIVDVLNLREIRLGLRWSQLEKTPFRINYDYYRWFLDYALNKGVKLCLNLGPVKVFGWPEEHLPDFYKSQFKDRKYSYKQIRLKSDLAKRTLDYYKNFLARFVRDYGQDFSIIQPENEPFNPMGEKRLTSSEPYLLEVVKLTKEHFPKSQILLNSNNRFNLKPILKFIHLAHGHGLNYDQFTVGYDYYYKTIYTEKLPIFKKTDPMTLSLPGHLSIAKFLRTVGSLGINTEVTEAQFEPWGSDPSPGNSYSELIYILNRTSHFFNPNSSKKLIRLWGIEPFAQKFLDNQQTEDHRQMAELIFELNQRK